MGDTAYSLQHISAPFLVCKWRSLQVLFIQKGICSGADPFSGVTFLVFLSCVMGECVLGAVLLVCTLVCEMDSVWIFNFGSLSCSLSPPSTICGTTKLEKIHFPHLPLNGILEDCMTFYLHTWNRNVGNTIPRKGSSKIIMNWILPDLLLNFAQFSFSLLLPSHVTFPSV